VREGKIRDIETGIMLMKRIREIIPQTKVKHIKSSDMLLTTRMMSLDEQGRQEIEQVL